MKATRYNAHTIGGFTYIELLAVVSIIGLIISLVIVRIDTDQDRIAFLEARRFAELVEVTRDESIINGKPMGIYVDMAGKNYRFAYFEDSWRWIGSDDREFRNREVPDTVAMVIIRSSMDIEDTDQNFDDSGNGDNQRQPPRVVPHIVVEPSGLVTDFVMKFSGSEVAYLVAPNLDQDIVVSSNKI